MEMFKNRNTQIALGVVLLVLIGLGSYYFFAGSSDTKSQEDEFANEAAIQTLTPEEIGLTFEMSPDNKKIKFAIKKAEGIKAIEYEMTYEANSTAEEQREGGEERVQRGITGEAEIKSGKSSYESEWIDLGSCSKNVCRYDTGVESVDMTLKLTKTGNKIYQVENTFEL